MFGRLCTTSYVRRRRTLTIPVPYTNQYLFSMPCDFTVWTPSWTGLAHFTSISRVQFFPPGSWYLFCDTRSQMKRWRFSVYYRFVYSFSRSFQLSFFIQENFHSKIIGCVDIMLTMRSAHCICFYGFKQDQLRSTIFNSITNYIFSLLKAIYSVVFALVSHHF